MLFNYNIKNIKDWAGIFQDKTAFAPLVKEIFRRRGLDFTGIDSCTPGSNAVFVPADLSLKSLRRRNQKLAEKTISSRNDSACGGQNSWASRRLGCTRRA